MPDLNFLPLLLFGLLVTERSSRRAIAIRNDAFLHARSCRNTVQGRYLISDDHGYVCDALSLDPESRCCPKKGEQYSCRGCNLSLQCCSSYELCVSCCLNPLQTRKELAIQVKIAKPVTAGPADTPLEAKLAGIGITVGRQGESCNTACKRTGQSCVPGKLQILNQCEIMQTHLTCKGGCMSSVGSDQPAEVVADAPKQMYPGACLYTRTYTMFSCDGSHQYTRRLCPCA